MEGFSDIKSSVVMNSRFSLAVHILTLLAYSKGERMTSDAMAIAIGANPVLLRRLLGPLREAGLVHSQSATGGGWELARQADEITLRDVRRATNEGSSFAMHRNTPHPKCPVGQNVHTVVEGIYERTERIIDSELDQITIASVLRSIKRKAAG